MSGVDEVKINIPVLARVEGEGGLELVTRNGMIEKLHLKIYEPPRLFEQLLVGRDFQQLIDAVARICGICPVAYQLTAVQAIENALRVQVPERIAKLRKAMYCGEWIESHALHVHLLALPDFLGFSNAIDMAKVHPEEVRRGLRLQAAGNDIIKLFGGRSVHPVGIKPGGFFRVPDEMRIRAMIAKIDGVLEDARALLEWVCQLKLPQDDQAFVSVSLFNGTHYPYMCGDIVSDEGLSIGAQLYHEHFTEYQVAYSTAKHAGLHGRPYLVGPLARMNHNYKFLDTDIKDVFKKYNVTFPNTNMYHSIIARAAEIWFSLLEARRLFEQYADASGDAIVAFKPRAAIGVACTEAPRGLLWHHYEFNGSGHVVSADIVPPTSQNQARIEEDLFSRLTQSGFDREDEVIRLEAEQIIRNYDPCISCSTHFLKARIVRHA